MSQNQPPQRHQRRRRVLATAGILFGVVVVIYLAFIARGVFGV